MGRNFYATFFDRTVAPIGAWRLIYAFGDDESEAFGNGFHPSDIQVDVDATFTTVQRKANELNEAQVIIEV